MENYDSIYNSVCRICLSYDTTRNMISLTDNTSEDGLSCFGKAVNKITKVFLKKEEQLPSNMCQNCTYLLKQAIYFKLKCESSNTSLKELINFKENKHLPNEKIKEMICDYTMFKHYFPEECSGSSRNICKGNIYVKEDIKENNPPTIIPKIEIELEMKTKRECASGDDGIVSSDEIGDNIHQSPVHPVRPVTFSEDMNVIFDKLEEIVASDTFMAYHRRPMRRKLVQRSSVKRKQSEYRNRFKLLREERRIRRQKQNQQLVCNICNRTLANTLTYDHHMQRHNNCRFICDQCGKGFPVQAEMRMHQVTRHSIGPYLECAHCPYKAPRKLNLIEHLRLHTGERPFTCEKCGLTFRRQAIWRNHLAVHNEKNVQCTHCPRKFYRQSHLLAHMNNVHERVYVYMCKVCRATYAKTQTVRKHMMVKHGIPREMQGKILRVNRGAASDFPGN